MTDISATKNKSIVEQCFKDNSYEKKNGKYYFLALEEEEYEKDYLNKFKGMLKKNPNLYRFLIDLFSPIYTGPSKRHLNKFMNSYYEQSGKVGINLGSGNTNISEEIINCDIFAYDYVDVVCDISNLPFKDNSIDFVVNIAVLEHVPDPESVVKEIHRVLKKDGQVYSLFPFMQGFHASPYDFSRRTVEGMKKLYSDFSVEEVKGLGGPTSGFLWIFQEWVALLFSFGIKPLYKFLFLFMLVTTWPIKFIDILLRHHPMAENISSSFTLIGTKK